MKYRNVFGELEYNIDNFFIPHRTTWNNEFRILKREPWYVTDAYMIYDNEIIWEKAPTFDSWIKAVRFLKEHINELI